VVKEHLNWIKRMLGADRPDSPEEENANVLKRMAEDGDDLTKARDIDFNHLFVSEKDAATFEAAVREQGYPKVVRDFWPEQNAWLTAVYVRMVPDLDEITAIEKTLDEIAIPLYGKPDGWGCMEEVKGGSR